MKLSSKKPPGGEKPARGICVFSGSHWFRSLLKLRSATNVIQRHVQCVYRTISLQPYCARNPHDQFPLRPSPAQKPGDRREKRPTSSRSGVQCTLTTREAVAHTKPKPSCASQMACISFFCSTSSDLLACSSSTMSRQKQSLTRGRARDPA